MSSEDQIEAAPDATREAKMARKHKAAMRDILIDLVEAMEAARADGFIVEFSVGRGEDGQNILPPDHPVLSKRW